MNNEMIFCIVFKNPSSSIRIIMHVACHFSVAVHGVNY